jgi:selenocysteine lyase/cysteine desulfurase
VLPWYANTHTESSGTGRQTTLLREEARAIIREAVGADHQHAVIFAGSGSTGAIDKLMRILGFQVLSGPAGRLRIAATLPERARPVVFVGPYEHHSNELLWRESVADVVRIPEDAAGRIDQGRLARELVGDADRPLRIGSFSAASNVTGLITDTDAISELLHRHGAAVLRWRAHPSAISAGAPDPAGNGAGAAAGGAGQPAKPARLAGAERRMLERALAQLDEEERA